MGLFTGTFRILQDFHGRTLVKFVRNCNVNEYIQDLDDFLEPGSPGALRLLECNAVDDVEVELRRGARGRKLTFMDGGESSVVECPNACSLTALERESVATIIKFVRRWFSSCNAFFLPKVWQTRNRNFRDLEECVLRNRNMCALPTRHRAIRLGVLFCDASSQISACPITSLGNCCLLNLGKSRAVWIGLQIRVWLARFGSDEETPL